MLLVNGCLFLQVISAITDFQMADLKEHIICIKLEDSVIPQRDQDSKEHEMPGVWKSCLPGRLNFIP
jgi:hypothetical protein